MIDALGAPQSLLVLGGTSDIAQATVARLAAGGRLQRVVLAARPGPNRDAAVARTRDLGVGAVTALDLDAADPSTHSALVDAAFAHGADGADIDVVLVAFGVLPDQQHALRDPAVAVDAAQVNYIGAMSLSLYVAARLRAQGHGRLVVLSSVAAERPRLSNFVYGSTKAGLDALATGLGDELSGSGAAVLVVRPGFVHTKMTAGLSPAPFATTPQAVADVIAANLRNGSGTVWVPAPLRPVMSALRHVPRAVFRRLPG